MGKTPAWSWYIVWYFFVGGMPSPVAAYTERHDLLEVQRILASITTTLQDDFAKYGTRAQQRNRIFNGSSRSHILSSRVGLTVKMSSTKTKCRTP